MYKEARAPSSWHVIRAIARRELGIASRRKLVRLLFLASTVPPLGFGLFLVIRVLVKESVGVDMGWDPVGGFLQIQAIPVVLLALGLGTPSVARDRAEDVLYLYAVRPVSPWHYTGGKMLSVAIPALLLLLVPAVLIAVLRQGVLPDLVTTSESLILVMKAAVAAILVSAGFAGASVGPSAATRRGRWALLIAISLLWVPDLAAQAFSLGKAWEFGPWSASWTLEDTLFGDGDTLRGIWCGGLLLAYGAAGVAITMTRVRREMIP